MFSQQNQIETLERECSLSNAVLLVFLKTVSIFKILSFLVLLSPVLDLVALYCYRQDERRQSALLTA